MNESSTGLYIHPTAVVDGDAKIGEGTSIWHFVHIREGATIGTNVVIGQGAYVAPTAVVGDGCKIQNGVSLFDGVSLGEDVFVGPNAVFTNVLTPRAFVNRHDAFSPTVVEQGATIGANATILCGIRIGRFSMIGAGAVVTKDVAPFECVVGNPSKVLGFVCKCGLRLNETLACECGKVYVVEDGVCRES